MSIRVRVGVDVGGTFTDLVALDEGSGELFKHKVPTTPIEPALGVFAALAEFRAAHPTAEITSSDH